VVIECVVAVQQLIEIGDHSFIAGGSLVRKNVPPYIKVAREPLSYIGVNSIGLRRRGYSDEQVSRLEDIYRVLFVHNNTVVAGVKQIVDSFPDSDEKQIVLGFIQRSEKGVVRGAQTT
jgi:UDP-N-acetylglucosamine acyltransferase